MSEAQPVFTIEKIYLKDLSLEIPNAPQIFTEHQPPKVDIRLHNEVKSIDTGLFEVVLTVTITAKHDEKTAFLVEVAQAGIFQARDFPPSELDMVVNVVCPNNLLPYARETVSTILNRAGFPAVLLPHVGFEAIYQQRLQEQQAQQQAGVRLPQASDR
jgi:preprotein translocase subunit SecB